MTNIPNFLNYNKGTLLEKDNNELYDLIKNNYNGIVRELSQKKISNFNFTSINAYCKIMVDANNMISPNFRKLYGSFYQMSERRNMVSADFLNGYYFMMAVRANYSTVCNTLQPHSGNKFQLSFISKLLHTINPNEPIFDKNIRYVLWGVETYNADITWGQIILQKISDRYSDIAKDSSLSALILKVFNDVVIATNDQTEINKYGKNNITFVKKCDFIFWVLGRILLIQNKKLTYSSSTLPAQHLTNMFDKTNKRRSLSIARHQDDVAVYTAENMEDTAYIETFKMTWDKSNYQSVLNDFNDLEKDLSKVEDFIQKTNGKLYADKVRSRVERLQRFLKLGAPETVINLEKCMLMESMAIYKFATSKRKAKI